TTVTSTSDLDTWIGGLAPGLIIKNFVCDIDPSGLSNRRRRKTGHRGAIAIKSLDAIRSHLQMVKETKPKDYQAKGYLPRGSIRTNGFRVQILAFKIRERQDARYKRLPQEDLPDRMSSTVAGTEYYLTEIRNVIRTKEDVERLWPGKDIQRMRILTLDGGQACVVGAFAHLPMGLSSRDRDKSKDKDNAGGGEGMEGVVSTSQEAAVEPSDPSQVSELISDPTTSQTTAKPVEASAPAFFNLAVKQKAVYQPTFRFRRWEEDAKKAVPEGEEDSIRTIESHLPPLRGSASSIIDYVRELQQVEDRLKEFYAGDDHEFLKRSWDHTRARQMEYQATAERLLGIVGGSLGRRLEDNRSDDPILIGIGLGQFTSNSRLSSLHSSFLEYFIKTARSLGYIVVGINEYCTSKKMPSMYYHRDVMAAENMYLVVRERLDNFQRPKHLQPIRADGSYPWMDSPETGTLPESSTSAAASSSTSVPTRKRASTTSNQGQSGPGKS
ncbi:hypothetical protein BGX24_006552, partial [Mortierella sp. AD032]